MLCLMPEGFLIPFFVIGLMEFADKTRIAAALLATENPLHGGSGFSP